MGCSRDFNSVVMGVLQLFAACLSLWDPIAFFRTALYVICLVFSSVARVWCRNWRQVEPARRSSTLQAPCARDHASAAGMWLFPRDLRTHILRPLGPKTILYKAFGLF